MAARGRKRVMESFNNRWFQLRNTPDPPLSTSTIILHDFQIALRLTRVSTEFGKYNL